MFAAWSDPQWADFEKSQSSEEGMFIGFGHEERHLWKEFKYRVDGIVTKW